jgi:hypothetical protein
MTKANQSVKELISSRILSNSKPGKRDESPKRKLGLVIEGGAMRTSVGGGMANGLESLMKDTVPFDAIYAVSAGVCTSYYLAARGRDQFIYREKLLGNFIKPLV